VSGEVTTHVLDTGREGPAGGVAVTLERLVDGDTEHLGNWTTNADGRVDEPLLSGDAVEPDTYQLTFDVGAYYRQTETESSFLETVPVRFVIADASDHYHVPLLLSPGGYTTYRGS